MTFFRQWMLIGLLVFAVGAGMAAAQQSPTATPVTAHVVAAVDTAEMRSAPTTHIPVLRRVPAGTEVIIIAANADHSWYNVRLPDNRTGWLEAANLDLPAVTATATLSPQEQALRLTTLGNYRAFQGQLDEAMQNYEAALNAAPGEVSTYVSRAYAYLSNGQYQSAIDDLNHAIELQPYTLSAYALRGTAYAQLGRYAEALADYDYVLQHISTDANLYMQRGSIYLIQQDFVSAAADFSQAIKLDSTVPYGFSFRGMSYVALGKLDDALADFNSAIELTPDDPDIYALRGFVYLKLGANPDQIRADFCRHLQLAGDNPMPEVVDAMSRYGWQCSSSS